MFFRFQNVVAIGVRSLSLSLSVLVRLCINFPIIFNGISEGKCKVMYPPSQSSLIGGVSHRLLPSFQIPRGFSAVLTKRTAPIIKTFGDSLFEMTHK